MASITAQAVIDRAFAYSGANDPGSTALAPELLEVLRAKLRVLYNRATRNNPFFSAVHEDVAPVDGKWKRPDGALRVIHIERLNGVEVYNVSLRDRSQAADPPRVYREGGCYYSVAEDGDPDNTTERLRFYYAEDSPGVASLDACLPAWFHDEHEELLVALLARHLAIKDKARGDIEALNGILDELFAEFDAYALEADLNVVGRFDRHAGEGLKPQGMA